MTKTILVKTDQLSAADLATCVQAVNHTLAKWAPKWNITAVATTDSSVPADMVANITNLSRRIGAYGYHNVVNKVPTAWISPASMNNRVFGYYAPASYSKAITSFGKVIKPSVLRTPARYSEGVVTVLIHEILEMLADSNINTLSTPDSTGKEWLVEVCDHVSGIYGIEVINGNTCVIPDATFPSYYDLKGVAPYDLMNSSKTPFDTNSPSFYGYTQDPKTGVQAPIAKGSVHHV